MAYLKQHQSMENFMESLVRDHKRYEPIVIFLDNIIQNSKELSWYDLEEIGLEVSQLLNSDFCYNLRRGMMGALNRENKKNPALDIIKTFAKTLVKSPQSINIQRIDELRDNGLSDQSIEDIIGWVCIMQFYAVLDQALGFKGLPQNIFDEIAAGTVQQKGYFPSFQYFVSLSEKA